MKKLSMSFVGLLSSCFIIVSEDKKETASAEDVEYLSVEASPTPGHIDGYQLNVKISLVVKATMSNVAPHINVSASCLSNGETYHSKEDAFFMTLSKAQPNDKKQDDIQLFFLPTLPNKPTRCDLTLQLSEGRSEPHSYCYEDGTKPGSCPK